MRSSDKTLSGKKIWVTRPAQQAAELCTMIEARQGRPLSLPALVILPVPEEIGSAENTGRLALADIVIFISKNAVVHARDRFPHIIDMLQGKTVLATGRATARSLQELGLERVDCVDSGGTEALLGLPSLSGTEIRDKRVLIVRGQGGREALRDGLLARGAGVHYLEVYRRGKPAISQAEMAKFWHDETPDALVITSLAALDNLVEMTPAPEGVRLHGTATVVMSERIRQHALAAGFTRVAVAQDNSDAGLLDALLEMNESS